MGKDSAIEWTHHTFNPWWGCARVSPGCEHCYAEAFAKRTGKAKWGVSEPRRFFGDAHWLEPLKWNAAAEKAGERHRVFCASMADVFEDRRDLDASRLRLWSLIADTPHLDWLLLSKRPENMTKMLPWTRDDAAARGLGRPWPNVWIGATVEDQKRADRLLDLVQVPAVVRFLSCEPLLGPVSLGLLGNLPKTIEPDYMNSPVHYHIHWVIVGGESGPGARPFDLAWARSIVAECRTVGVAVHVKQLGSNPLLYGPRGPLEVEGRLRDRKGGDWDEWPADLRIREYPEPR